MDKNAALLIIDAQKGFHSPFWGKRNNPRAEENIARLLAEWRAREMPVIHVRHCSVHSDSPLHPKSPGCDFMDGARPLPSEKQFDKSVNSAFIGTGLEEYLRTGGFSSLVFAGFTTDHCVSTSVRMAGNLGFNAVLVSDACAAFARKNREGVLYPAEEIHNIHVASLDGEFCSAQTAEEVFNAVRRAGIN